MADSLVESAILFWTMARLSTILRQEPAYRAHPTLLGASNLALVLAIADKASASDYIEQKVRELRLQRVLYF